MDRSLKIISIIIWSIIAIFLTGVIINSISTRKSNGEFFSKITFNRGVTRIQKEKTLSLNDCNKINLNFYSEDIIISSTKEKNLKVIEKSNRNLKDREKFTISNKDNIIDINQGDSHLTFNIIGLNWGSKLEVMIPENYNKDLEIKTRSGNIRFNDNIKLNNIKCSQNSGNLYADNSITSNKIDIKASSGNIKVQQIIAKSYKIRASSGNIDINSSSGLGEVEATSGNIKIECKDMGENLLATTSSGDIKIYVPKRTSFEFEGNCTSGNIKSNFDLNYRDKDNNEATAKVGNEPYKKISARATSGNISINEK